VLIDTCHRVELVTVDVRPGAPPSQHRGAEAVRRVFEVVAGFDSAVIAEEQLLGQVRDAYQDALAAGRSGPILNELMRRGLRFGRLVRSHARPGTDRSLGDPAVAWLRLRLPAGARVIVAGTGEMGHLLAARLAEAGHPVTVVSTSAERGAHVLSSLPDGEHRVAVGPITSELLNACGGAALAVRSRTPALTSDMLSDGTVPWVVDLSAPSTVERAAATKLGDRLLDVDHLGARAGSADVLSPASEARLRRRLVDEAHSFVAWFAARQGADALTLLHREADAVRRRHLERLRRRGALDDSQLAAVEASSAAMIGELLHGPTIELRRGGADAATVRRLFGIET
jgi:glutamyl-tRNA reductase